MLSILVGGDPVATASFNSLSATFPQGETFFIEGVRRVPE
jgi:predicted metal-dependent hydrolase